MGGYKKTDREDKRAYRPIMTWTKDKTESRGRFKPVNTDNSDRVCSMTLALTCSHVGPG